MMSFARLSLMLATATALCCAGPEAAGQQQGTGTKKLYCWDEGGRRVCGDALPASAVDAARTEISGRTGLPGTRIDRAMTPAERDAMAAQKEAEAEQAEALAAQRRRDLALADSYDSEAELRQAYRIRYDLVDEAIKSARLRLANQRDALVRLLQAAADTQLSSGRIIPRQVEGIRAQRASLVEAQAALREQQSERDALDAQLSDALSRYEAAKGLPGTGVVTTQPAPPQPAPTP